MFSRRILLDVPQKLSSFPEHIPWIFAAKKIAALLDTSFDHRAGLFSFPIKYLCHSSDISFHTWSSRSDKNSSYSSKVKKQKNEKVKKRKTK